MNELIGLTFLRGVLNMALLVRACLSTSADLSLRSHGWFPKLVKEVLGELVFSLLELLLADTRLLENGDVEGVLLALEHVQVHEVDDLV